MFLEQNKHIHLGKGWIEVITGSMFSGKTEELIRRINRVKIANMDVIVFKPVVDKRFSENNIVSHNKTREFSVQVNKAAEILDLVNDIPVVCIDEAQFFDNGLTDVCLKIANKGKRVIVAGLDMDFLGNPFGSMPDLLCVAEYITKLHAICTECGDLANFSFRKTANKEKIMLGEKGEYTPLCRSCYNKQRDK